MRAKRLAISTLRVLHMKQKWIPTQDAFDSLLAWLDADRERAGQKYERIRLRLIKIFTCRGCREAEDLADDAINRVMYKVEELAKTYEGEPALYFYGVAYKLYLEYIRDHRVKPQPPEAKPNDDEEAETKAFDCLDECLDEMPAENSKLLLRYYEEDKFAKINNRKELARELGIGLNALRIRVYRIRLPLQACVESCMERAPAH